MKLKIDRKCPFYRDSLEMAYYDNQKNLYIESQIVNVDCIIFMDQAAKLNLNEINDFARLLIAEYGAQRPAYLLSEYVLRNTEKRKLIREALKFLRADNNLHVQMTTEPAKVFSLFRSILREAQDELLEYRLFDKNDCEPLRGKKSLGRVLVMSTNELPPDICTQDNQLAIVTPELLQRLLYDVPFSGGRWDSGRDLSKKIIGVLKEERVPRYIRDILKGKPVVKKVRSDRPPLDMDKSVPIYRGITPLFDRSQEVERYLASAAANIDFTMKMQDIPEAQSNDISSFAQQLIEEYGEERPLYMLAQYFQDHNALNGFGVDRSLKNTDIVLPNFGCYTDGRIETLYDILKEMTIDMNEDEHFPVMGM